MKIYIKNMVCRRCELVVKSELESLGFRRFSIKIGEAEVHDSINKEQLHELDKALRKSGLEIMEDYKIILVEKIKNIIIQLVHYSNDSLNLNLSDYLSKELKYNYTYLANLFSEANGITIEKYYLAHRIEKVKELIVYDELNLSEIADLLHYSSVSHLSNQFKKLTGLAPSHFKKLKNIRRAALDQVPETWNHVI